MRTRLLLLLSLLALACGKAKPKDPNAPVDVTPANLAGYWYSEGDAVPWLLHLGGTFLELPGEKQPYESNLVGGNGVGRFALDGSKLQLWLPDSDQPSYVAAVSKLTANTLDLQPVGGGPLHFRRTPDCGGPGAWLGAPGMLTGAAWGPDGALHLLLNPRSTLLGDTTGTYSVVPPGRCSAVTPQPAVLGHAIGVGPDGTVRILHGAGDGIWLREMAAQPWARADLQEHDTKLLDEPASGVRPTSLVTQLDDGRTVLAYAHGGALHTWVAEGTGYHHEQHGVVEGAVTPQDLVALHQPGGALKVGPTPFDGWRWDGQAWSQYHENADPVAGQTLAQAYGPDGLLYAAWPDGAHAQAMVVGRRHADGTWDKANVGLGIPYDLRVRADGTVDVAFYWNDTKGAMGVLTLPPSLDAQDYVQSYSGDNIFSGFIRVYDNYTNIFPLAAWGPDGAVLVGSTGGIWRKPKLDQPGPHRPWARLRISFDGGAPATVRFPTLGLSCTATCELVVPPREIVPVVVETPDSSKPDWVAPEDLLVGTSVVSLGKGLYSVCLQHDPIPDHHDTFGTLDLMVHSKPRRLSPVVALADPADQAVLHGLAPTEGGGLLALLSTSTHPFEVVRLDGQLQLQQRADVAALASPPQQPATPLHARPGGKVGLLSANFGGRGGQVVLLDSSLAVEAALPLQDQDVTALADDGAWLLRPVNQPGGTLYDLIHLTSAGEGAPAHTPLPLVDRAEVVGDGLVAAFAGNDFSTLNGQLLYSNRTYLAGLSSAGALRWLVEVPMYATLSGWAPSGAGVVALVHYTEPITFAGKDYALQGVGGNAPGPSDLAVLLDGATGVVQQSRAGVFPAANGALASDAQGLIYALAGTGTVSMGRVPWDGSVATSRLDYNFDLPPGYCLGHPCGTGAAGLAPLGGAWAVGWQQPNDSTYDGFLLAGANIPAAGLWTP